jgi:hypothetical protein
MSFISSGGTPFHGELEGSSSEARKRRAGGQGGAWRGGLSPGHGRPFPSLLPGRRKFNSFSYKPWSSLCLTP